MLTYMCTLDIIGAGEGGWQRTVAWNTSKEQRRVREEENMAEMQQERQWGNVGAGGRGSVRGNVCVWEREVMATAQGKYAPIIRAILKSALGAIPLSCSPSLLLLLPRFPISHNSHALLHNLLSFPLLLIHLLSSNPFTFIPPVTMHVTRTVQQVFWYFAPCGRSVSPLQFRGPAGSVQHFF